MDKSSLRWKSQEVSWASQSDLEMEMFSLTLLAMLSLLTISSLYGNFPKSPGVKWNDGFNKGLICATTVEFVNPNIYGNISSFGEKAEKALTSYIKPFPKYLAEIALLQIFDHETEGVKYNLGLRITAPLLFYFAKVRIFYK